MGKNSAGREARRARQEEEAREKRVKTGSEHIRARFKENFGDDWFNSEVGKQKAATADEFSSQWETARKSLEAALMRAGLYDSTEGQSRMAEAELDKGRRQQDINTAALSAVQGRQRQVLSAEDAVLGQLRSSADLGASNAATAQQLAVQSQPIPFSPLGSVFQDFTAGLAVQGDQERQGTNRYNLGISGFPNNRRYTTTVKG